MKVISREIFEKAGFEKCALIVAHPDDETLWAGGTVLVNSEADWTVMSMCRKNDPDRAPKFYKVMELYDAYGVMGDLDDGPGQSPLDLEDIEDAIMKLLPDNEYDLIVTHSPRGEYTRHLRHEEIGFAVADLIVKKKLKTKELWMFAYEDGDRRYLPRANAQADIVCELPWDIFELKERIITDFYGFESSSFEARTTPRREGFWRFKSVKQIEKSLLKGKHNEGIGVV